MLKPEQRLFVEPLSILLQR